MVRVKHERCGRAHGHRVVHLPIQACRIGKIRTSTPVVTVPLRYADGTFDSGAGEGRLIGRRCRVERVTGIEPAFSAWEIVTGELMTSADLRKHSSAVLPRSVSGVL